MSYDPKSFAYLNLASSMFVLTVDDTHMSVAGVGSVHTTNLSLCDVYYIPNLTLILDSVSQLCDSGYSVVISSISCHVLDS